jgi:ribose transport system substrate-binding protein
MEVKRLRVVVSLTTDDNDYQIEQAVAAELAAARLGIDLEILYAGNDTIQQSQQILKVIQGPKNSVPDAIVFEPVGATALPQAARAAAAANIGWVVLNHDADYIGDLRQAARAPVFAISSDHLEIGRIQGQQVAALAPLGGTVLYVQGPTEHSAARDRTRGTTQTKGSDIKLVMVKGKWTEESAYKAVASWARLSTSQKATLDMVAAQDDSMALGARRAFQELSDNALREKWLKLPFLGCDGLPKTGQEYVRNGTLAATVVVPPNTTLALEMLVQAHQTGKQPAQLALTVPSSFPPLNELGASRPKKATALTK